MAEPGITAKDRHVLPRDNDSSLTSDVRFVRGVGASVAGVLAKLGIHTVGELLEHYPLRYEDRTRFASVGRLRNGENAVLKLKVSEVESRRARRGSMTITRVAAEDDTGTLVLVWFNQPWLKEKFVRLRNREIIVYGQARYGRMGYEMNSPQWEPLKHDEDDPWAFGKFVPVYPLTEGITQERMRRIVKNALDTHGGAIRERLPEALLDDLDLIDLPSAVRAIHWSESEDENQAARKRLVFDEFFFLQVALAQMRHSNGEALAGISFPLQPGLLEEFQEHLPFDLTGSQKRVIGEIWSDMSRPFPMNRMLQGDVGAGKTVVALAAMLLAARNGYQSAIMAPTEVLAEQHFRSIDALADKVGLSVQLLSGARPPRSRAPILNALATGTLDVLVGTHALIQEGVTFLKLGLVVIDEQHKFGVRQRSALRDKGAGPDMLVMTATPIPRTLTMTVYGDLYVSILDELPPGRKPVKTHWKEIEQREKVYAGVRHLLERGGQVYVVCPLVSESEKLQLQAATELADDLRTNIFPDHTVGLLHGQMKSDEKQEAIAAFREGRCKLMVCTTVVEVGVDVPGANAVVVENAERYGLAQLHQLRGRVGRAGQQAYCVLLANAANDEAVQRMTIMQETSDGFRIAEEDLRIRGPGEFFGVKQSGVPEFKIADVIRDVPILETARRKAAEVVDADPELATPEYAAIRRIVETKYRKKLLETTA